MLVDIDRALDHVIGELEDCGLLTKKLFQVEVYVEPIDMVGYLGVYYEEPSYMEELYGYEAGCIYIPAITTADLSYYLAGVGRPRTSLRDVIRHEYGHAFAAEHFSLIDTKEFTNIFGDEYDSDNQIVDYSFADHISDYASTSVAEDFAECFMVYVRCRGRISNFRNRPGVYEKLRFIKSLKGKIRSRNLKMANH